MTNEIPVSSNIALPVPGISQHVGMWQLIISQSSPIVGHVWFLIFHYYKKCSYHYSVLECLHFKLCPNEGFWRWIFLVFDTNCQLPSWKFVSIYREWLIQWKAKERKGVTFQGGGDVWAGSCRVSRALPEERQRVGRTSPTGKEVSAKELHGHERALNLNSQSVPSAYLPAEILVI